VKIIRWETSGVSVPSTFGKNHELVYDNGVVSSPFSLLPSASCLLCFRCDLAFSNRSYHSGCWILNLSLRGSWTYHSVDFGPNIPCTVYHGSWTCHCEDLGPIIVWTLDPIFHVPCTMDLGPVIARILDLS
jgi:hypothetical protein